ncbi:MAG: acyl-protein synthetase [Vallitaleaceae bacterium]|nr:acyl-protein synthetase [Vallitaleaceae bacterium]
MSEREKLFAYKKIYDLQGSEELFLNAIRESVLHHQTHCRVYDELLTLKGFSVAYIKNIDDIPKIPPIPVDYFKIHEIKSIKDEEIEIHATSSGTSGQKSQVFLDESTVRLGTKMIFKSMSYHKMISLIPTNYLLLGYEPEAGQQMGNVKVLLGMTRLAPAKEKVFAIRQLGDSPHIDFFGIIKALKRYEKQRLPLRIMGFPAYLYLLLKTMDEMNMKPLKFHRKSLIFTGGGWKNYNQLAISKDELYDLIEKKLSIPRTNCRDFYSAVEHSVAYPECCNHHMHVPIWSRVLIRDVKTLEPLGFDKLGFLNFISPLVSSMPLHSVLMGDLAVLRDGTHCGCGITTPYFEILGRAGTSTSKSCVTTANEMLGAYNESSF